MKLTDAEILELTGLVNDLVEGRLTAAQDRRLQEWLRNSDEARRWYVRYLSLSSSLHEYASEMQTAERDAEPAPAKIIPVFSWSWRLASLAAAACVALAFLFLHSPEAGLDTLAAAEPPPIVAKLTASKDSVWNNTSAVLHPGDALARGQRLELAQGFAEVTFDSGARVTLEGPATMDLNSAWDATLQRGTLKANVPAEAVGFRINNSAVEVVDLGTEFSMVAEQGGATEVIVLKGSVETASRLSAEPQTTVLREKEGRRFASTGTTAVGDHDRKLARFLKPVVFDQFTRPASYVQWSFDEKEGAHFAAKTVGTWNGSFEAVMEGDSAAAANWHTAGRWNGALNFDGQHGASLSFPGLATNAPRTVAFWVKVPEEAALPDAGAMLAWEWPGLKKNKARSLQIGWNRAPKDGALGTLRTDFGRVATVGTTPLRDGHWHHVAVVLLSGKRDDGPVQLNQYVDGRLDGVTSLNGRQRKQWQASALADAHQSNAETIWLGRSLAAHQRHEHFRGQLDEVFFADRALSPPEIAALIQHNSPVVSDLAANEPAPSSTLVAQAP